MCNVFLYHFFLQDRGFILLSLIVIHIPHIKRTSLTGNRTKMDFDGPNFFMDLTLDQIEPKICDYDYNLIECTGFPPTPASSTNETDVSSPDNNNNNINGGSVNNTMISPTGQCFGAASLPINSSALADFTMDSFHQSASTLDQNAVGGFDGHGHASSAGNYILFNEPNGSNSSAMAIFNDISISGTDTSEILNHLFEESIHMEGLGDSMNSPQQHHSHHLENHRHHSPSGSSTGSFGSISTVSSPVPGTNDPNTFLGLVAANSNHGLNSTASVSTPSSNDPPSPLSGHSMLTSGGESLSGELTMVRVPPPQQQQHLHHPSSQVHGCNKTSKRSSRNRALKNSGLPVLMDVKSAGTVVNSSKACFVLTDEVKKVLVKDGMFLIFMFLHSSYRFLCFV